MADYTLEELQDMFNDKLVEEMSQDPHSGLEIFRDAVTSASDLETQKIDDNGIIVGHILKSNSENKQYTEQRYYINEIENESIVGRTIHHCTYQTGSYSDSLTTPTLQIVGTTTKDRTVLKG